MSVCGYSLGSPFRIEGRARKSGCDPFVLRPPSFCFYYSCSISIFIYLYLNVGKHLRVLLRWKCCNVSNISKRLWEWKLPVSLREGGTAKAIHLLLRLDARAWILFRLYASVALFFFLNEYPASLREDGAAPSWAIRATPPPL